MINSKLTIEKMFANNDPAVDLGRYLSVQRAYLKATENYFDACFEVNQAVTDLAQAVAEPALAVGVSGRGRNKGQ